ncbi:MAG: tetratricopeptide repeat protein [Armatimonadetes bacterium]|nr:tetratricopeptide repeat protein [Armatimonadota bacterium]NIM23475.1 tetratricopeptide repeat protein [Armatimonadota bacterium]NIM67341.1 tetratricopeptide repeat protein [Armatimonadota bacterium]NIM75842.1 tetratricopeptide repeat protein [Armatimonadota bacterium]NIN05527.1 tetratricopeptide repeat protein [Armatimonadota bacterium]
MLSPEALEIIERLLKAAVFVPVIALVGWWLFSNVLDKTLSFWEAAAGFFLLGIAFVLGVVSIVFGGWGFWGIIGIIVAAVIGLLIWQYMHLAGRQDQFLADEISKYQEAIERDPLNAAAYSFLGQTYLKLGCAEEAVEAFEEALRLDPESRQDRSFLKRAKELKRKG